MTPNFLLRWTHILWVALFVAAGVSLWTAAIPKIEDHFVAATMVAGAGSVLIGVGLWILLFGQRSPPGKEVPE